MSRREVTVTRLEMTGRDQLRAAARPPRPPSVRLEPPDPGLSRELYRRVGDAWHWHDRRDWSREQWSAWLEEHSVRTWVARHEDTIVGYFELAEDAPGAGRSSDPAGSPSIEIAYLGLLPDAIGRGWGGWLLTRAVEEGWALGASRVWLHTCTLDHPAALANYRARGFRAFDEHTEIRDLEIVG